MAVSFAGPVQFIIHYALFHARFYFIREMMPAAFMFFSLQFVIDVVTIRRRQIVSVTPNNCCYYYVYVFVVCYIRRVFGVE